MIKEYKVIKEFGAAKVGDVFTLDAENDVYVMRASENNSETYFSSREMILSSELAAEYADADFLVAITVENTECECSKVIALKALIADLKKKYEERNQKVQKKYDAGKMQTCVKVEHDTVHFNLMKLLNQFEEILNN